MSVLESVLTATNEYWDSDGTCSMCGVCSRTVEDHCHVTGWVRGWLCVGCNNQEARSPDKSSNRWYWWRRLAPKLIQREEYCGGWGATARQNSWLTDADVERTDLSVDDLLRLNDERRNSYIHTYA